MVTSRAVGGLTADVREVRMALVSVRQPAPSPRTPGLVPHPEFAQVHEGVGGREGGPRDRHRVVDVTHVGAGLVGVRVLDGASPFFVRCPNRDQGASGDLGVEAVAPVTPPLRRADRHVDLSP